MIEPDEGLIVVAILGIEGPRVEVGIAAPKHISVDREEIYNIKKNLAYRPPPKKPDKT